MNYEKVSELITEVFDLKTANYQLARANAELLEALKAAAINPNQQIVIETILKYTRWIIHTYPDELITPKEILKA